MLLVFFKKRGRRTSLPVLLLGSMVVLSLLLAACGSGGPTTPPTGSNPTSNPATSTIVPLTDLITPGVLTVGSDTTYPPQEYIDTTTHKAAGFDVDLITAIAHRMGLQANIVTTKFNTIIDDLVAKRFDVVISAVNITPERHKKVDFVPYLNAGESLLVQKGNPHNLKTVADLCGQNVGVQKATVELGELAMASKDCVNKGKKPITMIILQNQTEITQLAAIVQLLTSNRVVATYQDSPVTDYYVKQNPDLFEVGGAVVNANLEGIAVCKGDTSMFKALQAAFNAVKADGTYQQLLLKWGLINEDIPS